MNNNIVNKLPPGFLHIDNKMIPQLMKFYLGETAAVPTSINMSVRRALGMRPNSIIHLWWYGHITPELAQRYPYFAGADKMILGG